MWPWAAVGEVRDWLRRWDAAVPRRDRIELVFPPALVGRFALYALRHRGAKATLDDPGARDPELVALLLDFIRVVARIFRLEVEGGENVPAAGPALLVGNHNGGLVPMDTFFTVLAIFDRLGPSRAVSLLAHDFLMEDQLFHRYALRLGAVRASRDGARRALHAGNLLVVYPGGDVEVFRPFHDRRRIDLAHRTGFIQLALRERVPIIPVVSAGTHEQLIVLSRGDRIARAIRLHEWARAEVFPLVFSLPWGITSGFLPYVPIPAQTTVAFGEPIVWPALDPDDPAILARCFAEVEHQMQAILNRLYVGRRPFVGRPSSSSAHLVQGVRVPA